MAASFSRQVGGQALRARLSDDEIELLLDYLSDPPPELNDPTRPQAKLLAGVLRLVRDFEHPMALEQATKDGHELSEGLRQLLHLSSA